jgi:hypothetical protein
LPASFERTGATRTTGRVRGIDLTYANRTASLAVSKSNLTWYDPRSASDPVSIGSRTGEYRNLGPERRVSYTCAEWRYSISGSGVSKSLLVEVARSVGCA